MQFKKLRLVGFKSFVEQHELVIETGLTGIVGPNGCGKSNLAEALRWVMGESSHKNMRAGAMDDVIFSGSSTRPPRNVAEVTLFLDNSDRSGPDEYSQFDELEVSRRIERANGSRYRINGRDVRAKDVQYLFADQSTGARSPSMVGQGRIGEIILAKPQTRRLLLEEAAGISGLNNRRYEAEIRLRNSEDNLQRLDDILSELAERIDHLKRQTRQAARYRALSAEIRQAQAGVFYVKWHQLSQEEADNTSALNRASALVGECAQKHIMLDKKSAQDKEGLKRLREEAANAAAKQQYYAIRLQRLEEEHQQNQHRFEELQNQIAQLNGDIAREQALSVENNQMLDSLGHQQQDTLAKTQDYLLKISHPNEEQVLAKAHLAQQEATLLARRQDMAQHEARFAQLSINLAQAREKIGALKKQQQTLHQEKITLDSSMAQNQEMAAINQQVSALTGAIDDANITITTIENEIFSLHEDELAHHKSASEKKNGWLAIDTQANTLTEILNEAGDGDFVPIADNIGVKAGYELALGAALSDELAAPTDETAPRFWRQVGVSQDDPALPAGLTPLSQFVDGHGYLSRFLHQIAVIEEGEAEKFLPALAVGQALVSRQGALWRWDGYCVLAGRPNANAVQLAQKNKLAQLMPLIEEAKQQWERCEQALTTTSATLKEKRSKLAKWRQTQEELTAKRAQLWQQAEAQNAVLSKQASRLAFLESQLSQLGQDIAMSESAYGALNQEYQNFDKRIEQKSEIAALETDIESQRQVVMERQNAILKIEMEHNNDKRRLEAILKEQQNWQAREQKTQEQIASLKARYQKGQDQLKAIEALPQDSAQIKDKLLDEVKNAQKMAQSANDNLVKAESADTLLSQALSQAERALSSAREERVRAEERLQAASDKRHALESQIGEIVKVSPRDLLGQTAFQSFEQMPNIDILLAKLDKLKGERQRLGGVNLQAEIEQQELQNRHDDLTRERGDIIEAIAKLRQAINDINEEGRQLLRAAFDQVNGHFKQLFRHLFNGGEAYLKLTSAEDPLESGLEIYAQLPGKRAQTMTLLSGGEQALTALALIFAVFLTSPIPICVLDEVDAPLDDHNVERYCDLMQVMANETDTRFVVITHNPITMARMNRLFGVTMGEKGVSQLVSVDLETAETFIEK